MKKECMIIMMLFVLRVVDAQDLTVKYLVGDKEAQTNAMLFITDTMSYFQVDKGLDFSTYRVDGFFAKNYIQDLSYETVQFFNKVFYVSDSINKFKWSLLSDTSTFLGYKCLMAGTSFRGRNYVAYYAPDIALSEGPWKFGGLPGLILSVRSDDGFVEWTASEISINPKEKFNAPKLSQYKFLPWAQFVQDYKEIVQNYIKYVKSKGILPPGASSTLKTESVEIFYPQLQTGEGIKF